VGEPSSMHAYSVGTVKMAAICDFLSLDGIDLFSITQSGAPIRVAYTGQEADMDTSCHVKVLLLKMLSRPKWKMIPRPKRIKAITGQSRTKGSGIANLEVMDGVGRAARGQRVPYLYPHGLANNGTRPSLPRAKNPFHWLNCNARWSLP
jgi:hypothetical protein